MAMLVQRAQLCTRRRDKPFLAPTGPGLGFKTEHTAGVAPKDRDLLVIAETGCRHDVIDRTVLPRIGMVAAKHDLPNANLRSKVAKCFGTEDQGVKIKLLEVFSRLLFQRDIRIACRRVDETGVIRPVGVGWQNPTAVGRDNLETWEAVERALKDQVRQRDRRLGWQANRVREPAIAFETLGQFRNRLRVDEEHRAELFGLGPDGMEFRVRKVFTGDAAANIHSAQPLLFHRVLELLYRQVRKLQGNRSKGGEAVRLRRAKLGKF